MEAIRLYCGIGERAYNHHPVYTGPYACVSPVCGKTERTKKVNSVSVPDGVSVIQDSGAFSDGPKHRLSPEEALERQIAHAEIYSYADQITHRASYDLLIDEKWAGGVRQKARWTENDAELAVKITVKAATYLAQHRNSMGAILSAQGVSARQYLKCTEQIIPLLSDNDIFGLGGWCVIGKFPKQFLPVFQETIHLVIPTLARASVRRVHIWGVCYPKALGELLWLCDQHGIQLSTDSVGPSTRPCFGEWGYGSWRKKQSEYQRPDVEERGRHRKIHVYLTRRWLRDFREREPKYYQSTWRNTPYQPFLLEEDIA